MTAVTAHASHDVMPPWLALVIYATGFFITARAVFMVSDDGDRSDRIDRLTAAVCGLIWPIALVLAVAYGVAMLPTLGAKTRQDRRMQAKAAERERLEERQRLAARIAELEAENERWQAGEP